MIARRKFLTGLAAGIAAPLIVPHSSLMAMPRAPIYIPRPGDVYFELEQWRNAFANAMDAFNGVLSGERTTTYVRAEVRELSSNHHMARCEIPDGIVAQQVKLYGASGDRHVLFKHRHVQGGDTLNVSVMTELPPPYDNQGYLCGAVGVVKRGGERSSLDPIVGKWS